MILFIARSAETVYNDMVAYLKSGMNNSLHLSKPVFFFLIPGGNDKRYKFVNGSDLRPYKIKSGVEFMIQAIHTTKVHHYNDTLDFLLSSNPPGSKDETLVQVRSYITYIITIIIVIILLGIFNISDLWGLL